MRHLQKRAIDEMTEQLANLSTNDSAVGTSRPQIDVARLDGILLEAEDMAREGDDFFEFCVLRKLHVHSLSDIRLQRALLSLINGVGTEAQAQTMCDFMRGAKEAVVCVKIHEREWQDADVSNRNRSS